MNPATGTQAARQAHQITAGELAAEAARLLGEGYRLAVVAAHDDQHALRVVYVFCAGPPDRRAELEVRLDPARPAVPSLAGLSFPASRFEREIRDLFGIVPDGHPFPRRLVLHQHWPDGWHPMRRDAGPPPPMQAGAEPFPFVKVEGPGVYEIPVGPVHAGLIEPGHFRFSVVGETILKMKARLWFLHRGVERLFEGQDIHEAVTLAECVSGDSAVAHNLAYCLAVEDACQIPVPLGAARLRALLLELERLYNHVADIGALCNDVGFGLAQARALTLREKLLRLNAEVTGHRLLRGAIRPGHTAVRRLPAPPSSPRSASASTSSPGSPPPIPSSWTASRAPPCSPPRTRPASAPSASSPAPPASPSTPASRTPSSISAADSAPPGSLAGTSWRASPSGPRRCGHPSA